MMLLKYLFSNTDLAEMIVKNWEYDDLEPFKYWRISSNAIYPFKNQERIYFLRFTPAEEKSGEGILAELDFLKYLKDKDYSAIEAVPSKNGRELETVDTPWGKYHAAVFKRVEGKALDDVEITDDIALLWGRALGKLHKLSSDYVPEGAPRLSWTDQINWIRGVLEDFPKEKEALRESEILKEFFSSLPVTYENYGLIHYDFELDNVFYDEKTNTITPIDFDDSMYHWYAMDIEQTMDSIKSEVPEERVERVSKLFLEGYSQKYSISEDMMRLFPVFRRFADLYGYIRVLRSAQDKWANEPEWMEKLRGKLNYLLNKRSSKFGSIIE